MDLRKSALVGHTAERMFDLIEAAEHYPAFLPWCAGTTILARDESVVVARIAVDYHGVRLQFTTRNPKRRPDWMAVTLEEGPFRRFEGDWLLTPLGASGCKIDFTLRYELDTAIVRTLAAPIFDRIASSLVDAFVMRAERVLGPGGSEAAAARPWHGGSTDDR
jgi:ribosome-associated toxin RatA of RatAB toxin-antitoxin module